MRSLARDGQLACYRHEGFWQAMDTLRDRNHLEELWARARAPGGHGRERATARPARLSWSPASGAAACCVTGHTGFKGSWLALWLQSLGARVTGLSDACPHRSVAVQLARVGEGMEDRASTCATSRRLPPALAAARPEVVIHMAAQSLVRRSFVEPRETYETNVMGTVNVLERCARPAGVRVVVNVTSDKCYENREWEWGYREHEPMGGHDPYSSSKGCAELVTDAFRRSFFSDPNGHAPGLRPRGQRDRRRRLGRGPAGARHHAGGAGRRAGARAQSQLGPPVAARAQPAQRLPGAGPGAVATRPSTRAAGTSAPPTRTRVRCGWIVERMSRAVAAGASLGARRRSPSPRGALPQARLLACAGASGLASAGRAGVRAGGDRRVVSRAARRARTCARVTLGQIEAFQYAAASS